MSLPNLGEVTANLLYTEGYRSLEDIAFADSELLSKTSGVEDLEDIEKIQTAARIALRDKLEKMTVEEAIEETSGNDEAPEEKPEAVADLNENEELEKIENVDGSGAKEE